MPHFRTMLSNENFCAADLWSEKAQRYATLDVQIVGVKKGKVVGEGGREKTMPFITMKSAKASIPKPLGLNATNCKTMVSISGSPNTDKWIGQWVTLIVIKTTVGKDVVDAIRLDRIQEQPSTPTDAPPPGPTNPPASNPADLSDEERRAIEMAERLENGDA